MRILKENPSMFATNPTGIVKRLSRTDNKFGYINSHNASGQLPVVLPVPTPDPEPTPPAETTPPVPPASEPEKPKEETAPQKDADSSMLEMISYGAGALVGCAGGYLIAKKYNKNVYGGLFLGGGLLTGGVYLVFNGKNLLNKISRKSDDSAKSNASGKPDKKKCKGNCDSKYKPLSDYWKAQYYKTPFTTPMVPLANPKITLATLNQKMSQIGKAYDCCLIKCDNPRYSCSESFDV